MDDGRQGTRLERIAHSLAIAIASISAGLALYREYQTLRRESNEFEALQVKLKNVESQLVKAQQTQHLDAGAREQLTQQLVDIRRRVRAQLGKAETANSVDSTLRKAQNALECCGGPFLAPYPDVGISSSDHPPDDFLPPYPSSSRYLRYTERHPYPLHTERDYSPSEDGGRYSPTDNFPRESRYPPNIAGSLPSGHQYGNGGYSRGNQYGTRAFGSSRNRNPF